jgi:predicted transcriptional regulator
MRWSRFFMLMLVCTAVVILCIPGAASASGSQSGDRSGGSAPGETAGAASSASSGHSGFSSPGPAQGSGTTMSSPGGESAQAAGADRGAEPGISEQGAAAGDRDSPQDGQDAGRSPDNDQGPGSPQDFGSGEDSAPGPRFADQDEPSRKPESGIPGGPQSGFMGADATAETTDRILRERIGFQGGDEIRSPAGIIVFGAAGGIARSSDIRNAPGSGEGAAGGHPRESAPKPPWYPSRDTKSVPPETAARIEPGISESQSRPRAKREDEPDEVQESCSSVPAAPAPGSVPGSTLFFLFSLFGFRRIRKKNVLENDCRRAVFHAIADAPGIDAVSLSRTLEMNINTLRYHLAKLLATDKITYLSRPGTVRYYLNQGIYTPFEQLVLHYLRAGTAGRIIRLVSERPGISRQDLAAAMGISGPSVTRHIQQLSTEGIIRNDPDGRANHYYLTHETALLLKKFQVTPTGSAGRVSPAPV